MTFTVYNEDGSKRTEWASKSSAIAAVKALKIAGLYVVNEQNCEVVFVLKTRAA